MRLAFQNILLFILLVLIQIFVLDNIQFLGYVTPMIYVLFILSLPLRFPRGALLVLAFALGMIIDIFSNTMGMHAFATVFVAFMRKPVTKMFVATDEIANPVPSFRSLGVSAYVKYVIVLVLLHHTVLFLMESFSFRNIYLLIPKILISSAISIVLILGAKSINSR